MDKDLTLEDLQAEILAAYRLHGGDEEKYPDEFTDDEIAVIIQKSKTTAKRWANDAEKEGVFVSREIVYRKHRRKVYKLVKAVQN